MNMCAEHDRSELACYVCTSLHVRGCSLQNLTDWTGMVEEAQRAHAADLEALVENVSGKNVGQQHSAGCNRRMGRHFSWCW